MADVSQIKIKGASYNFKDSAARNAIAALPSPMVFKGTLGAGGTITTLPTASASTVGYTYKVITTGTYASIAAKVGDVFVCSDDPAWVMIPSGDDPSGTVTNITTGAGLTGGPITTSGTISLSTSGVVAGTYQGLTIDAYGRVTKATNLSAVKMFEGSIVGDGSTTAFTVTHNMNTKNVLVQVFDNSTGETVVVDTTRATTTAIIITFNEVPATTDTFKVLVLAMATLA